MILVTYLLDRCNVLVSWTVEVRAATTDIAFLHDLRNITYSLLTQGATIVRIEVNCMGTQTWMTVAEVLLEP
jgi:hypothetical protein